MEPVLSTRHLTYRYPDRTQALRGVDFDLYPSETVALLGANGSGKTTFVLHLNGILTRENGTITVTGLPMERANLAEIRRKVGLVLQDPDDQLFMPTVLEDVSFGPLAAGVAPPEALESARAALTEAGYTGSHDRPPYHLSAGEKRRVAIAGVLASRPEILILDEPTTFLDPPAQRALARAIRRLTQAKIVVTHDCAFAQAVASRAVFFANGVIAAEGSVSEIVERFGWRTY